MTTNKWESQQRTNHRGGKTRWKKDGKRTEPLLLGICVCIFMPTPGWHDCRCVHVCPGEGYKWAACWRVNCGVSLTWQTPPVEARWCDAGFGEEEEEEFDNTCALPRYWSHRCRRGPKSRCPSCHFGLDQNYFPLSSQIPFNGSHFRRPQLANSRSSLNRSGDDLVPFSYIPFIIKLMHIHWFWHKSICSSGTCQSYLPTCDATCRNIAFIWWICSDLLPQSVKNDF